MMTENADKKREQIHLLCMDEMVPKDHLLRIIDKAIDWTFIYDLVKDKYSHDTGRPSMDPVTLIKIPLIQYLYGIKKEGHRNHRPAFRLPVPESPDTGSHKRRSWPPPRWLPTWAKAHPVQTTQRHRPSGHA